MDAISSIGNFFSSGPGAGLLKVGELGSAGAGLVGNILNERARSNELGRVSAAEKTLADPTALAKQVAAATQPLDTGLTESVGNAVDASLAEKGLTQAPGIARTELSQALAPFEQANQNTALQLVLTRLGLPLQYAQTFLSNLPPNVNLAPLLALLGKGGGSTEGLGPDVASFLRLISGPQDTTTIPATGDYTTPPDLTGVNDIGDFSVPSDVFA